MTKVGDRIRDYDNITERTGDYFYIGLYLRSGGIPYQEEVRVYNLLDFIGNVGGFLGLLLGASLVSVFDQIVAALKKCQSAK